MRISVIAVCAVVTATVFAADNHYQYPPGHSNNQGGYSHNQQQHPYQTQNHAQYGQAQNHAQYGQAQNHAQYGQAQNHAQYGAQYQQIQHAPQQHQPGHNPNSPPPPPPPPREIPQNILASNRFPPLGDHLSNQPTPNGEEGKKGFFMTKPRRKLEVKEGFVGKVHDGENRVPQHYVDMYSINKVKQPDGTVKDTYGKHNFRGPVTHVHFPLDGGYIGPAAAKEHHSRYAKSTADTRTFAGPHPMSPAALFAGKKISSEHALVPQLHHQQQQQQHQHQHQQHQQRRH